MRFGWPVGGGNRAELVVAVQAESWRHDDGATVGCVMPFHDIVHGGRILRRRRCWANSRGVVDRSELGRAEHTEPGRCDLCGAGRRLVCRND